MNENEIEDENNPAPFQEWGLAVANLANHGFNHGYLGESGKYNLDFLYGGISYLIEIRAVPSNIIQFPKVK